MDHNFLSALNKVNWSAKMTSDSMAPIIKRGDVLSINPVDYSKLRNGDIVAFFDKSKKSILVHRLFSIRESKKKKELHTKGDIGSVFDEKIDGQQLAGQVINIKKENGKVIDFSSKKGLIFNKLCFYLTSVNNLSPRFQKQTYYLRKKLLLWFGYA